MAQKAGVQTDHERKGSFPSFAWPQTLTWEWPQALLLGVTPPSAFSIVKCLSISKMTPYLFIYDKKKCGFKIIDYFAEMSKK